MLKHWLVVPAVAFGLALSGCAGSGKKDSTSGSSSTSTAGSNSGFSTSGADGRGNSSAQAIGGNNTANAAAAEAIDISQRIVYFDFDSSAVRSRDLETVANHAKYLTRNPNTRVRLEGHADERGTREYNVGLGERRANAVRDALLLRGVSARQISVVSYGEERPVSLGHNERAWDQNRRVEFVY